MMIVDTRIERGGRRLRPLALLVLSALVVAVTVATQQAGGAATRSTKPVIGKPRAVPAQPVAGKRFAVSFRVTQGVAGAPLTRGRMICDPSVAGQVLPHAESFKAGVARLAFAVPTSAAAKVLRVKVTIKAATGTATRVSTFRVLSGANPSISIAGASIAEGGAGTVTMSFSVTLSTPASQPVSVAYATADGTATAPSDYASASGTLVFARGEKAKAIAVTVVGDANMEQDETFSITLSHAVNATIATGSATGTITNDDTAVAVTAGSYQGATQNGDFVFLAVTSGRTVTGFRVNNVALTCDGPLRVWGIVDWTDNEFTIRPDGSFRAEGVWDGSIVSGDAEWTHWDAKLAGLFASPSSPSGTILINRELNYKGTHYRCSSGTLKWSATLQS